MLEPFRPTVYVPSTTGSELVTASNADQNIRRAEEHHASTQEVAEYGNKVQASLVVGRHHHAERTNVKLELEIKQYNMYYCL